MCKMHYTAAIKLIFVLSLASRLCAMELGIVEQGSESIKATYAYVSKKRMLMLLQDIAEKKVTFQRPKAVEQKLFARELCDDSAPILRVAQTGNVDLAGMLLALDGVALEEYEHEDGSNALHVAVAQGNVDLVHVLLIHGFNIERRDYFKRTPLLRAALSGHTNVVRLLLKLRASKLAKDIHGFTALDNAILSQNQELVEFLYDAGVRQQMRIELSYNVAQ